MIKSTVLLVCVVLGGQLLGAAAADTSRAAALPRVRVAQDGRGFVTADGRPFVPMGVTYFRPGTGWAPQVWKQFDAEATRKDFARMRELGVTCARVFLSYGSFFMQRDRVSEEGFAKFDQFLRIAEEAGIYVHPTGPDHWEGLPDWARGDRYADEQTLAALETFWRQFAARYRGRGAIFAYDLLNEPEVRWDTPVMREKWNQWLAQKYGSPAKVLANWGLTNRTIEFGQVPVPPAKEAPRSRELLDYQLFRESIADTWTRRQVTAIKSADPQALVTVGLIQWSVPSLLAHPGHYSAFRPSRQAPMLDFLEVHFYPLDHGAYEYRDDESELRNLAYLEGVVREVAKPGKPVVLAEFGWYGGGTPTFDGGKHPAATEEQQARWCRKAVETSAGLVTGWLNWGFYDHPGARDVTELIGLCKPDGTVKAWGREFKELAGRYQGRTLAPAKPAARPTLDWDLCITSPQAANQFRADYAKAFRESQPAP